jgi:DNA primase
MAQSHVAFTPAVRRAGDIDVARLCLAEEFAKLTARRGHAREIAEAVEDMGGVADEGLTWRLGQAAAAIDRSARGAQQAGAEYEVAENGARVNKEERNAFDQLLGKISLADRDS